MLSRENVNKQNYQIRYLFYHTIPAVHNHKTSLLFGARLLDLLKITKCHFCLQKITPTISIVGSKVFFILRNLNRAPNLSTYCGFILLYSIYNSMISMNP